MKRFFFPLDRVLAWLRTQARLEEIKLERLLAEKRALEARRKFLVEESGRSFHRLVSAGPLTGADLQALDHFRRSAAAQAARVETSLQDQDRQIAVQTGNLSSRRREVRLIEQLREEKLKKWQREFQKEIDQQAEESYLARFRAAN